MNDSQIEMPKYKCYKEVWALKIAEIFLDTDGSAMITSVEAGYAPFGVDSEYVRKHDPQVGGYFVRYEDGYKSFSHKEAFEGCYSEI